jgi:uncharacterized protein YhaN
LNGYIDTYPDWAKKMPDSLTLETEASEVEKTFISVVEALEAAWEKAQTALTAVAGYKEALARRQEDGLRKVQSLILKITGLKDDGKSQSERETALQRLTMSWESAVIRLNGINAQLEQYEDDPGQIVSRLEAQLEDAGRASVDAREKEVREETILESLGTQGIYSSLGLIEEQLVQLEEEVKREEVRMEAIRVLHETVATCRTEAIASISGPVEATATRTLHRIAGRRMGAIKVGEGFSPSAVVPDNMSEAVQVENLSGSEQEQLYLATRLALADVLGRDDRQLVVLDDVLTATDSGRLARVMNILEEAAERFQILILTCHPERYRGLKKGTFHDLEKLVHGSELQ